MPTKAESQLEAYLLDQARNEISEREKLVAAAEAATVAEVRGLIHLFYRLKKPELRFSPAQEQLGKATEAAVLAIETYDADHPTEAPQDGAFNAEQPST